MVSTKNWVIFYGFLATATMEEIVRIKYEYIFNISDQVEDEKLLLWVRPGPL